MQWFVMKIAYYDTSNITGHIEDGYNVSVIHKLTNDSVQNTDLAVDIIIRSNYMYMIVIVPNDAIMGTIIINKQYLYSSLGYYIYPLTIYLTRFHKTTDSNISHDIRFDQTDCYMSHLSTITRKVWLLSLWTNWMYDLVDRKNVKCYAIGEDNHPVYLPPWEIEKYYSNNIVTTNKSTLNSLYTNINCNVLFDKKCYIRLRYLNNYIEHINCREVRFYSRKYYNIGERHQRHNSHSLRRSEEIKPLKRGKYVWQRVPFMYDPYRDTWMSKQMYKLHPWDSRMLDWVGVKNYMLSNKQHWDGDQSYHNGVKYYGYTRKKTRGDEYYIHRLRKYVNDLYDIDIFNVYITIFFSRRKFFHRMYDVRSVNKMLRKYGMLEAFLVEDIFDNQSHFLKIDSIRTVYGVSSVTPKLVADALDMDVVYDDTSIYRTDVEIQSTTSIQKQSSWIFITKEWLADYDWLSVHLVTFEIIMDILLLHQYNIYSPQNRITPVVRYKYDYWYNLVVNGLHSKTALVRLVSREYGKYHMPLIVDTDEHDLNGVANIYSDDAYISISALIDIEYNNDAREQVMRLDVKRNLSYNRIYNARSLIDWTVKADRNNNILNVLINANAHRSLYNIVDNIRCYGAVDNNVIIGETKKYCKYIFDSDLIVMEDKFRRTYKMVHDYNYEINNDSDEEEPVITAMSSMVETVNASSVYHGRRWRAKVERMKLYRYNIDMAELNKYKYNKAILFNKDSYVNDSIIKSLKAANIVDSNYDGHWEDIPLDQVNPLWYSVRNIYIKAKLRVLRHIIRWDNATIIKFFDDQEKWEQFIRNEDVDSVHPNEMYNLYKYHVAIKHINVVSHNYKIRSYVHSKLFEHCGTLPFDYMIRVRNRLITYKNIVNKPFALYNNTLPILADIADQVMYDSVYVIIDVHNIQELSFRFKSTYVDRWPKHDDIVINGISNILTIVGLNVKHTTDIGLSNRYGQKNIPVYVFAWYVTFIDFHSREQPIKKEEYTGLISLKINQSYGRVVLGGKVLVNSSRKA